MVEPGDWQIARCLDTVGDPAAKWYYCQDNECESVTVGPSYTGESQGYYRPTFDDSCVDTGDDFGGGTCSAERWTCSGEGIFEKIPTGGSDVCDAGTPDRPSLKLWECANNDNGAVDDTCVEYSREGEEDSCVDFGQNSLGGGGCDALDWVCQGTQLIALRSGGEDSCGGTEDNPSVTHWSCSARDGTLADTCISTLITRQDECEQLGGNRYGGGSCKATNWYCDPGDVYTTAILRSDYMEEVDTCSSAVARHFICGSIDGGSPLLTDSCVPQQQDCDDPAVGGLGDVCTNGVCNSAGTYCIEQNRLPGDDCRNGDGNTYEGCDLPDTCDEFGQCDLNIKTPGFVCRAGSGDAACNPDEVCSGNEREACPPDEFSPEGTACGGVGDIDNDCDALDTCDASGICKDNVKPAGTECRPGSPDGICDPTETCTGEIGKDCPGDVVLDAGTICNPGSGDLCDVDEECTGKPGENCPQDRIEPATKVCRESITGDLECDPAENCLGIADAPCPVDFVEPVTTLCGDGSTTECTDPDTCDGLGECLLFHNKPCGSATNSSLCEFDTEPAKGDCSVDGSACLFDLACAEANGITCTDDNVCLDAKGESVGSCTPDVSCAGDCEQSDQFRLIFTPDVQNWPAFKLNASNPGQTYYNVIYDASGANGADVTLSITIPYPYVTQGGNPLHVYDADTVGSDGSGCLDPESSVGVPITAAGPLSITLEDWSGGAANKGDYHLSCNSITGPNGIGSCTFEVTVLNGDIPTGGLIYLNVHLDFGLRGKFVDANPVGVDDTGMTEDRYDLGAPISPWGSADALVNTDTEDGDLALEDCRSFWFQHTDGAIDPLFEDQLQNLNVFKGIAGAFGQVANSLTGEGYEGLSLTLARSSDPTAILKTSTTDEDGAYGLLYKHKGKPAPYNVNLYDPSGDLLGSIVIELQGNGWTNVDFDSHATYQELCDIDKAFCECNGWCAAAEYGSGRQSGGSSGGGGVCELTQTGEVCNVDSECCSGACSGKPGKKICK